ncbi:MAG: S49 family peptidase [Bacteroidota bacterium]|nr:S49 family peptidase [Bacteroidota bacterium]
MSHTFHIPVLGLGYSIDTPLKVSRYGISSVLSIVDDELIERMREYHSEKNNEVYNAISKSEVDSRARRITAYLNLLARAVNRQFENLKAELFEAGSDLCRYFELLPEKALLRQGYDLMMEYPDNERKAIFQNILRQHMTKGSIDVNIMSKVDKMNFTAEGEYTGSENTDALAALRGFAESDLESAIILSAGMNPRLYSYIESFNDFFPDKTGKLRKRIILKVSDFRSALIQAKFLAKKGLWVSEFRVESGLNCGGHAFATDGFLLGPILEEFKEKRQEMVDELYSIYQGALINKNIACDQVPEQRLSVQGGIGTAAESNFLMERYHLDATGWGSPFLLVPEVTNVDEETLMQLAGAREDDFYLSGASPLGILFNNFKPASMEKQRNERIENDRPGSPCTKKYLCTNTEFTEKPICTSSREYQNLKIKQLQALSLPEDEYREQFDTITEKICLCEGLCSSAYLKYNINKPKENTAVSICPGPNMAYFSRIYSLEEMVSHIYGRLDLLENIKRPHVFIKELNLYIDYLQADLEKHIKDLNDKKRKHLDKFKAQLQNGIAYYKQLFSEWPELIASESKLDSINI